MQAISQEYPFLLGVSVDQQVTKVKKSRLCFSCLRKGHHIKACTSEKCSKRLHSVLPFEKSTQSEPNKRSSGVMFEGSNVKMVVASTVPEEPVSTAYSSDQHHSKYVLLTTALMSVERCL